MTGVVLPKVAVVTGAGGFIGRHLSKYLGDRGCDVRGIGHSSMADEDRDALGISHWYSGGISTSALSEACKGAEIIYHCAGSGSVPLSMREPMTDFRSNVMATAELLEFSREEGGIPLVYLSTAGVYGKADRLPIRTDDPYRPISPYGMNKLIGEQLVQQYATFFGVPSTILRLFSVYGEGLRKQLLWDASHKLRKGESTFFGTGDETRDWIHVSDAVRLICCIGARADHSVPVFHGATGEAVRIRDILEPLAACYGIDTPITFNGKCRPGDPTDYRADVSASFALGWRPQVALTDGIARYADWFRRDVAGGSATQTLLRGMP
ncbi:hypothetical protein AL036_19255 [Salipiger aestuarii]|uniref:UDP-glucose 4-epimerase n=1 Tax=Salipiger aestuarii TaxID=568098 RepID=A0A327XLY6_9RHOB|nr:NAD-dependent epimerase/dehydratase family protein [Salipiger aestuarii]EIE51123.1 nucleoside-diphosphate-sugar epimerase protein [Citreicella sp. 357]KAA8605392.1 hypothetical protein AL036_19255 [Salipiger aestuarii]KAB2538821.1 hypothetical protein AL035_18820 [Salipiger aestuarii]RAK09880.1 UDP-glucose 4-epimerase [Salipiger aestuarii]